MMLANSSGREAAPTKRSADCRIGLGYSLGLFYNIELLVYFSAMNYALNVVTQCINTILLHLLQVNGYLEVLGEDFLEKA